MLAYSISRLKSRSDIKNRLKIKIKFKIKFKDYNHEVSRRNDG